MTRLLLILGILVFVGCGNNPVPPAPIPVPVPVPVPTPIPVPPVETTFEIQGKKILVKAVMKPKPKVTIQEMRAAVLSAVGQLEPKP